ncbi:MAG: hypothetical protein WC297_01000 [Candidatus Paceibacterota bacterium]|jgi:spore cortex formation protein SpoVR/YcgB (stage V sporulation)
MPEEGFGKEEIERQLESRLEIEKQPEKKPEFLSETEKQEKEKIREEIKRVNFQQTDEEEAQKEAESLKTKALPGKIDRLFELAKDKGLFFALKIAESTGDGYLIDVFHDLLAKDSFFKKFVQ